jgi:hypothetical protein
MRGVAWVVLPALVAACGYRLAGAGPDLPASAKTVSISVFRNSTREPGLELALRRAIEEEFRRRGPLEVVSEGKGDLVVSGRIRRFQTTPVAFTGTSEAVQFQGILQVSFRLTERASGNVLYENQLLQESLDFGAVSNVVVTSSPRFQRGTIDSRDLIQMNNVQLTESRRRESLGELVEILARDVYLQSMEGF